MLHETAHKIRIGYFFSLSFYVFIGVYMLSCYGAHVCILVWMHEVDIRVSSSVTLKQGISLNLGLSVSATLATQNGPGIFNLPLSLPIPY